MVSFTSTVSRLALVGVVVLVGGVVLAVPAHALVADQKDKIYDVEQWVTLDGPLATNPDGRGDRFLNFDANWDEDGDGTGDKDGGPPNSHSWVDWPVNLVFVSDDPGLVSTSKVKDLIGDEFGTNGGPMHAFLSYSSGGEWHSEWDVDKGRKMFASTCDDEGHPTGNPDKNYHFRIYGPLGEGTLYHYDYGNFVIATSHIDYREHCENARSGWSEVAEGYFADVFEQRGLWVERKKIWLGNAIDTPDDPGVSDGYATVVHLDKGPPTGGEPGEDPPAVVDAGPDVDGAEGAPIELRGTAVDGGMVPWARWTYAKGSDVDTGATCAFTDQYKAATQIRCTDDGTFTVTLAAQDGHQAVASTDTAVVHVSNVAPSSQLVLPRPWQVFRAGDQVTLGAAVTDPGDNDTLTCTTNWDDRTASTDPASGRECRQTHTFTSAGMYTIRSTVTDDDGGVSAPTSVMVVVFDPIGHWANADGSYLSTAGALTASPDATGEAWFHLAAKYYPQNAMPLGTATTWLPGTDYRFTSTGSTLDWLVVTADGKVAARGTGTLAGLSGRYGFVFYAYDGCDAGGAPGACMPGGDRFRAVVWPLTAAPDPGAATVYDNQSGASYDVDQALPVPLSSGTVLIQ